MRVAIIFDQPHWTGIGTYAVSLYDLLKTRIEGLKLIYAGAVEDYHHYYAQKPYLKRTNTLLLRPRVIRSNYKNILKDSELSCYLFHYVGTDFYALKWREGIITIHDLIKDRIAFPTKGGIMKSLDSLERYRKYRETIVLSRKALKIVSISYKTHDDLKTKNGLESVVIHHWIRDGIFKERDKTETLKLLHLDPKYKYFLSVGNDRESKRLDLIKEFSDALPSNYRLIKIGAPVDSKASINIGRVGDDAYPLYFNAVEGYLHLSDDEGFGWPIVESLGSLTPVICRDLKINRELLGNAAIYVEESLKDEIPRVIKIMENELFIREIKTRMKEIRKMFSSENAANEYVRLYEEAWGKFRPGEECKG
ncbi:MAG: hypothetical protein QXU18_11615 [Thermoplasmatales archaeon]